MISDMQLLHPLWVLFNECTWFRSHCLLGIKMHELVAWHSALGADQCVHVRDRINVKHVLWNTLMMVIAIGFMYLG